MTLTAIGDSGTTKAAQGWRASETPSAAQSTAFFTHGATVAEPVRAIPAMPERASANNRELRAHALMAQDVYADTPNPPEGYRVASQADLQALGLNPAMLSDGDFRARVYVTGDGAQAEYSIAFRGSQSGGDWVANAQQATGFDSAHYRAALAIGERIARSPLADQVDFTGHSLGGGLAATAAVASGRPADTFNAAGLHGDTIAAAASLRGGQPGNAPGQVDAWYVRGEILSLLQDGGDRVIGGVFGGIAGGLLVDAPEAYGERRGLDSVAPNGKNWLDRLNPVDRHGMDWVLQSLPY